MVSVVVTSWAGYSRDTKTNKGQRWMPKTTHTLLHLGQQVRKLGPLWTASCFPFESFYHYAVKLINGTRYALHQVSFHFLIPHF